MSDLPSFRTVSLKDCMLPLNQPVNFASFGNYVSYFLSKCRYIKYFTSDFLSIRLKLSVDNDVRGFQTIVEMIRSINCPSLVQLGLVFTSNKMRRTTLPLLSGSYGYICVGRESYNNDWEEAQFTTLFIDLVQRLPKLVTLLVVFPSATTSQCKAATAIVESQFRPTRPCFCVQITENLATTDPPKLPLVHYNTLALDKHPSVGGLPYHLTPSDQIY